MASSAGDRGTRWTGPRATTSGLTAVTSPLDRAPHTCARESGVNTPFKLALHPRAEEPPRVLPDRSVPPTGHGEHGAQVKPSPCTGLALPAEHSLPAKSLALAWVPCVPKVMGSPNPHHRLLPGREPLLPQRRPRSWTPCQTPKPCALSCSTSRTFPPVGSP